METIGIKYRIPNLRFKVTPSGNQTFNTHYRLISNPSDIQNTDNVGWLSAGTFIANNKGENINGFSITNLLGGYNYQVRLTHASTGDTYYFHFISAENTSAGDSPYYNKVLFPNQTYDWYINGVPNLMQPALNPVLWYYALRGSKAITKMPDAYRSVELYALDSWAFGTTAGRPREIYQGFLCENDNICRMPYGVNEDADHTSQSVFVDQSSKIFGMSFFLKSDYQNADIITFRNKTSLGVESFANYTFTWSIRLKPTGIETVTWDKTTGVETVVGSAMFSNGLVLNTNEWYNMQITDFGTVTIFDHTGTAIGSAGFSSPLGSTIVGISPIIFGNPRGITKGLIINRIYLTNGYQDGNINIKKIMSSYQYTPVPGYYQGGVLKYKGDPSEVSSIKDNRVSIIINHDILTKGVTTGTVDLKILMSDDNEIIATKTFTIKDVEDNVETQAFDMDFANNYADAMLQLKQRFYTKHGQWGGYNGGVSSHLVYGNGHDALIMANHGDNYTGVVPGVGKETDKGTSYDGYGGNATYDAYNDTRLGQSFKTRVGSVLVSNRYFPYGEMTVSMLIPPGTYGVCPALWFFHYQEYSESDARYAPWIARGWPRQGSAEDGYYTVVNNEIDIELPSHNIQGSFKDWNEVATAYFDPLALDTQYQIGLDQTATNLDFNKIGLFRLNNVSAPNLFSSWTQVAYTYNKRIHPNYSSVKFNNWVGEYDSGNGWAKSETRYREEETYLALLTQVKDLEDTFADNRYHDYTIKWYPDRTELWIDGQFIRQNRAFVPFNVMKYTVGGWFPSMPKRKVITNTETGAFRYEVKDTDNGSITVTPGVNAVGTWAGINANFEVCNFLINRIAFTPYTNVDMTKLEYSGESFPESGLREIL